jgi:hypothetical protein
MSVTATFSVTVVSGGCFDLGLQLDLSHGTKVDTQYNGKPESDTWKQ